MLPLATEQHVPCYYSAPAGAIVYNICNVSTISCVPCFYLCKRYFKVQKANGGILVGDDPAEVLKSDKLRFDSDP